MTTKYITMSMLGRHGRWANQLFQYMFLHVYAKQHDLTVQTAPWVGEQLFDIEPAPITVKLPPYFERLFKSGEPFGPPTTGAIGRDFRGYAQYDINYFRPYRDFLRGLLRPTEALRDRMAPTVNRLDSLGQTRIGLHLRRGDYGRLIHYITPVEWYLDWLKVNWERFERPVLFVASEDRGLVDEFARYNPQTAESLGINLRAVPLPTYTYLECDLEDPEAHLLDFFPDFYLLTQCQHLLIPNSTFSFVAAMLSEHLEQCWRSDLPRQQFRRIDVWDTTPLTYETAEEYKHVPGVWLKHNPPHWP